MRSRRVGMALALALTAASCSSGNPAINGTPTALRTPTVPGSLKTGTAHLVVGGSLKATLDLPLDRGSSQFHLAPAGFAVFWKDLNNNLVSLGGVAFNGTQKTATGLVLGFNVVRSHDLNFATSSKGECSVTMRSSASGLSGSFRCESVKSGEKAYSATGTFSAAA